MTEVDESPQSPQEVRPEATTDGAQSDVAAEVPLNADGRERPRFLLEFPADPELQRLVRAFEAGDYSTVREDAPMLAERTADPIVRAAARELRRRIDPDPLMKYLLCVALALFVFVVWHTYTGQH